MINSKGFSYDRLMNLNFGHCLYQSLKEISVDIYYQRYESEQLSKSLQQAITQQVIEHMDGIEKKICVPFLVIFYHVHWKSFLVLKY